MVNGEFSEYTKLKERIEEEKKRVEESSLLQEKKMNERSNRLKVMQIEFLKQY